MIRIGIDPGLNGFICWNIGGEFFFNPIPTIGKELDIQELNEILSILKHIDAHCVLEDVHSIFGASSSSTFNFGWGLGVIEGILVANQIPYTKVAPKKWQKEMFEGVSLQQKPSSTGKTMKTDTKAMAEVAAKRLFPNIDLRATERSKKSHDGKIDALLMCSYCMRNFK